MDGGYGFTWWESLGKCWRSSIDIRHALHMSDYMYVVSCISSHAFGVGFCVTYVEFLSAFVMIYTAYHFAIAKAVSITHTITHTITPSDTLTHSSVSITHTHAHSHTVIM